MTSEIYYHPYHNRDRLVHILDHDLSTCEGLSVLFRLEGFQTVFSQTTEQFYPAIERRRPDIVILNGRLGPADGLEVLRTVRAQRGGTPVFVLVDRDSLDIAIQAMKYGAADVITRPIDTERLLRAVRDCLRRDVHIGPLVSGVRPVEVRGFNQLTPREREVLQLITNGESNKEAGRKLGISPRTIEVHRARVMEKLGARNTADLLRIVLTS
ncbi:Two-component response regulator, FixJ family, consists of REC and HTH domains [Devosia enhydra]|uniref:Two-component response regulator, FixJ family, consists of REC and HTH domains n=1 Tax=Devosia enhydra TaxID=665118 RepID=A0A1K2I3B8_9HYPH|nr:LuxR C-terminal-related transcriptional regulator [Devosia enhydra]SFZ86252.1 Two-component response regulator, FixJ family, consists of REC and HTH domains [Devosia enhydra]